jgi:ribosomal protein S4
MACLVERLPPKQGFWLHPFLARRLQPIFGRASFAHASEHARKVLLRFETASNRHI